MQKANRDGNRKMMFEEMKKTKCLSIWSSSGKFAQGTRARKKLKHKRRRRGGLIWMYISE
jgi:heme-degrading monooxygenase HmoA